MQTQLFKTSIAQNLRKQGFSNEEIAEIMVLSLAEIENLLQRES